MKLGKLHPWVAAATKTNYCNCKSSSFDSNCNTCPNPDGFNLCNQPYALCTSAKCDLVSGTPGDPNAIYKCYCDIERGCSMGTQACNTLAPFTSNGTQYIFSTYNPKQLNQGYSLVTCPASGTLINCLNKICTVDPKDPRKALCYCSPESSGGSPWIAVNKTGEPCSCNNLSGATSGAFSSTVKFWQQCKNINIMNFH